MTSIKPSPFKFLDSYQQSDKKVFFGRKKETQDLYNALTGVKVLLVYGPSGSGKTSLIECGLRNLYSDADWFALTIRRGNHLPASVYHTINRSLNQKIVLDPLTKLPPNNATGFAQAVEKLFTEKYQPIYLLFDQFEELLISGTEDEKKLFFTELNNLIRHKVPCRILLIMREEFIGHLSEFESLCPGIFQHRFRVEKMGRKNVEEVIFNILSAPTYLQHFTVEDPQKLTDKIISKLPDKRKEIDLAHVQVFLGELWDRAQHLLKEDTEKPLLHAGLIRYEDNLESVLRSFLQKQIKDLESIYGVKAPLELLSCMISDRLTKIQISEKELRDSLSENKVILKKPIGELLHDLESRRIIRALKMGDETQYEISHDVLALVVGQNRTEEMKLREKADEIYKVYTEGEGFLTQDDIDYLRPFKNYLAYPSSLDVLISKSKKSITAEKRKKYGLIASIIFIAIASLIAYTIKSRITELRAKHAEALAKASEVKVKDLLKIVLKGRGDQYETDNDSLVMEQIFKEQTLPIEKLITPRVISVPVSGTKNYDFLIWIDVPSFRWPEIKEVEYAWPCKKRFIDSVHIGRQPTLGYAFGYRGWGYCPKIDIKVILNEGEPLNISFDIDKYFRNEEESRK